MKKRILLISLLIISIAFVSGCSNTATPGMTLKSAFTAIKNKDFNMYKTILPEKARSRADKLSAAQIKEFTDGTAEFKVADMQIIKEEISGDKATVTYKVKLDGKSDYETNADQIMIREKSGWKFDVPETDIPAPN